MLVFRSLLFALIVLLTCHPGDALSQGAKVEYDYPVMSMPMDFRLVRSAERNCFDPCGYWIAAEGRIDKSTPGEFTRFLNKLKDMRPPIYINSSGGDVMAAMQIGRMIRTRGFDVIVARTQTAYCRPQTGCIAAGPDESSGIATGSGAMCNSACPLILGAGRRRVVLPGASVGVHRIRTVQTIVYSQNVYNVTTWRRGSEVVSTQRTLVRQNVSRQTKHTVQNARSMGAQLNPYLREVGISTRIVELMDEAPPEKLRFLWRGELNELGLVNASASDIGSFPKNSEYVTGKSGTSFPMRLEGLAGRSSTFALTLHSLAGERSFSLIASVAGADRQIAPVFRAGLPIHRAISPEPMRNARLAYVQGGILLSLPKSALCEWRDSQAIRLNFGASIRGSRFAGIPYRVAGQPFFRSTPFFETICAR